MIKTHSLLISYLLCLIVVILTAWPILQQPRLDADDYRYLHHIQQVEVGNMGAVESMTVENRWDHLWFLQEEGKIRFFRPTVIMSYALDHKIWGDNYALGLTVSNVWIHLLCCWVVGFILHRLLGGGLPAIVSSLLFAGLATHSECIWYIAGRTDTLAAFGFLGAFALHISGRRWWALPLFAFGFITKELVIVAPVVFAAYDLWVDKRKSDWKLYAAYGGVAAAVLVLKKVALGGEGSDFVHPYLIVPFSSEFFSHLWLQFRSYTGNLLAAEVTVPFADAQTVSQLHHPVFAIVGVLIFLIAGWFLRKDRRFWLLVLLGILAWLPTSFVYLSERYLYLPSVAFVGLLGLIVASFSRRWHAPLGALLLAYAVFHSVELHSRHEALAGLPGSVQEMVEQLEPVGAEIEDADRVLLVNLPGHFVRAQFAQDIFRVVYDKPDLKVDVLTMMPGQDGTVWKPGDAFPAMGSEIRVERTGDRKLQLAGQVLAEGQPPHPIQVPGLKAFNWAPLERGGYFETPSLEAIVTQGTPTEATQIGFRFLQPLDGGVILIWSADSSDLNAHPWIRRRNAIVTVEHF